MNPPVLYVDDDKSNLIIFEAALEGILPVLTASSGPAALEILRSREVAVLLTDQRMPGMSGVDLAEAVKNEFPHTIRMLITAYSDLNAAIESINRGQIHLYLRKPWDARELRLSLEMARERYLMEQRVRDMESRLASTERIYSLGVIAAGIAHELRNPLGALQANLALGEELLAKLRAAIPGGGGAGSILGQLEDLVADCASASVSLQEITSSMELTARSTEEGLVDLTEVIHLAERSMRPQFMKVARLDLQLTSVPPVRGTRTRYGQVLLNLMLNAIEAMDPANLKRNLITIRQYESSEGVHVEVEDNGPGLPEELLTRIFDPFYSTKPDGGTGLGLAISRQIIDEVGGTIEATSEVGVGTRFLISLPKAEP